MAIPSSGRWTLLGRTLRSALAQADVKLEVVLALDTRNQPPAGLTGLSDRRVRIVRPSGRGLSTARNAAVDAAAGEWIAFLDDDDLWAPTKLSRQLAAASDDVDFVYSGALTVDDALQTAKFAPPPDPEKLAGELLIYNAIPAGASNVLVRTEVVRDYGGFDRQFSHLADWDLWIRLADSTRAVTVPDALVAYVQHGESMLLDGGSVSAEFKRLARKHAKYAAALGSEFDNRALLQWLEGRYAAAGRRARARLIRERCALKSGNRRRPSPPAMSLVPVPDWLSRYASSGSNNRASA